MATETTRGISIYILLKHLCGQISALLEPAMRQMSNAKSLSPAIFFVLCCATSFVSPFTSRSLLLAAFHLKNSRQLLCADYSLPLAFRSFLKTLHHGRHHEPLQIVSGLLISPHCTSRFGKTQGNVLLLNFSFMQDIFDNKRRVSAVPIATGVPRTVLLCATLLSFCSHSPWSNRMFDTLIFLHHHNLLILVGILHCLTDGISLPELLMLNTTAPWNERF